MPSPYSDDGMRIQVQDQGDVHPLGLLKGRSPGISATSHPDDVLTLGAKQQETGKSHSSASMCAF